MQIAQGEKLFTEVVMDYLDNGCHDVLQLFLD